MIVYALYIDSTLHSLWISKQLAERKAYRLDEDARGTLGKRLEIQALTVNTFIGSEQI